MIPKELDQRLGFAQFTLSVLIIVGFLLAIGAVFYAVKELTQVQASILTGLLSTLGTVFVLVANFWFARHRPQSAPSGGGPVPLPTPPEFPATSTTKP